MATKIVPTQVLTPENFGELFHMALRKNCRESDGSLLLHGILGMVDEKTWIIFLEVLCTQLRKNEFSSKVTFADGVRYFWRHANEYLKPMQNAGTVKSVSHTSWWVLIRAGNVLTDADWMGATAYIWEQYEAAIWND